MFLQISITLIFLFIIRVVYVIRTSGRERCCKSQSRTLIVIGSGGHTMELLRQIVRLNPRLYQPRLYVMANSDSFSQEKIRLAESNFKNSDTEFFINKIPRSRNVNQSYLTSILSTAHSAVTCIPILLSFQPDLILCNGPGTCIPVCLVGFLMKVLFFSKTKIIFIESICRVKSLSLTGKILLRFADKVLVQWEELHAKYPKTEYIGRLM